MLFLLPEFDEQYLVPHSCRTQFHRDGLIQCLDQSTIDCQSLCSHFVNRAWHVCVSKGRLGKAMVFMQDIPIIVNITFIPCILEISVRVDITSCCSDYQHGVLISTHLQHNRHCKTIVMSIVNDYLQNKSSSRWSSNDL